jgi:hypothetical protein
MWRPCLILFTNSTLKVQFVQTLDFRRDGPLIFLNRKFTAYVTETVRMINAPSRSHEYALTSKSYV